jgi:hypothetical protein
VDYDYDSEEDWEEDEPGESLSDTEKDDEDGCGLKAGTHGDAGPLMMIVIRSASYSTAVAASSWLS